MFTSVVKHNNCKTTRQISATEPRLNPSAGCEVWPHVSPLIFAHLQFVLGFLRNCLGDAKLSRLGGVGVSRRGIVQKGHDHGRDVVGRDSAGKNSRADQDLRPNAELPLEVDARGWGQEGDRKRQV